MSWTPPAGAIVEKKKWAPPVGAIVEPSDEVIPDDSISEQPEQPIARMPDDDITKDVKANIQKDKKTIPQSNEEEHGIAYNLLKGVAGWYNTVTDPFVRPATKVSKILDQTVGERSAIQGFKKKNIAANDELAKIYKTPEGQTILTTNALLKKQYNDIVDIQKTLESDQVAPEQKASFQQFYEKQVAIYNQTRTNLNTALDTKPELKEKYEKAIKDVDLNNRAIDYLNTKIKDKAASYGDTGLIETIQNNFVSAIDGTLSSTIQGLTNDYAEFQKTINKGYKAEDGSIHYGKLAGNTSNEKFLREWAQQNEDESMVEKLRTTDYKEPDSVNNFSDFIQASKHELFNELPTALGSSASLLAVSTIPTVVGSAVGAPWLGIVTAGFASRYLEEQANSADAYKQSYDYLSEKHPDMTDEEKRVRSLAVGDDTFANNAPLIIPEVFELAMSFLPAEKFLGRLGKTALGTRTLEYMAMNPIKMEALGYLSVAATESFEEVYQGVSAERAMNKIRNKEDQYDISLSNIINDPVRQREAISGLEIGWFMKGAGSIIKAITGADEGLKKKDIPNILAEQDNLKKEFIYKALDSGKLPWVTGNLKAEGKKKDGIFSDMTITDEKERIKDSQAKAKALIEELNEKSNVFDALKYNDKIDKNNRRVAYMNQQAINGLEKELEVLAAAPEINENPIKLRKEKIAELKEENKKIGEGANIFKQKLIEQLVGAVNANQEAEDVVYPELNVSEDVKVHIQGLVSGLSKITEKDHGAKNFMEAQRTINTLQTNPLAYYSDELKAAKLKVINTEQKLSTAKGAENIAAIKSDLDARNTDLEFFQDIVDKLTPVKAEVIKDVPAGFEFVSKEDYNALNNISDKGLNHVISAIGDLHSEGKIDQAQMSSLISHFQVKDGKTEVEKKKFAEKTLAETTTELDQLMAKKHSESPEKAAMVVSLMSTFEENGYIDRQLINKLASDDTEKSDIITALYGVKTKKAEAKAEEIKKSKEEFEVKVDTLSAKLISLTDEQKNALSEKTTKKGISDAQMTGLARLYHKEKQTGNASNIVDAIDQVLNTKKEDVTSQEELDTTEKLKGLTEEQKQTEINGKPISGNESALAKLYHEGKNENTNYKVVTAIDNLFKQKAAEKTSSAPGTQVAAGPVKKVLTGKLESDGTYSVYEDDVAVNKNLTKDEMVSILKGKKVEAEVVPSSTEKPLTKAELEAYATTPDANGNSFTDLEHATWSYNKRVKEGTIKGEIINVNGGDRVTTKEQIDQAKIGSESANVNSTQVNKEYDGNTKTWSLKIGRTVVESGISSKDIDAKFKELQDKQANTEKTKEEPTIVSGSAQTVLDKIAELRKKNQETRDAKIKNNETKSGIGISDEDVLDFVLDTAEKFVKGIITLEDAFKKLASFILENFPDKAKRMEAKIEMYNVFENLRRDLRSAIESNASDEDIQSLFEAAMENSDTSQNFKSFTGDGEDKSKVFLGKLKGLLSNIPNVSIKRAEQMLMDIASQENWNSTGKHFRADFKENIKALFMNGTVEEEELAVRLELIRQRDIQVNKDRAKSEDRELEEHEKDNRLVFLFNNTGSFRVHPVYTMFQRTEGSVRKYTMEIANAIGENELIKSVTEKLNQLGNEEFVKRFNKFETKRTELKNSGKKFETMRREVLQHEIDFMKNLTGLDFTEWLNRPQFTEGEKDYITLFEKGKANSWLYNLIIGKAKGLSENYGPSGLKGYPAWHPSQLHIGNLIAALTYTKKGQESSGSLEGKGNPINQLIAEQKKKGSILLAPRYNNVTNKSKTATIMESAIRAKLDKIGEYAKAAFYKANEWVQFNKNGLEYKQIEGMKNIPLNKGNSQREVTSNDLRSIMFESWRNGDKDSFLIPAGKLGDRDIIMGLNAKKYGAQGKAKFEELFPDVTADEIEEIIGQYMKIVKGEFSFHEGVKFTDYENFVYDYFINKHYMDLFLHGYESQYGKKNSDGTWKIDPATDMIKRSATLSSTGMRLDTDVKGGLGKTHLQMVFEKIKGIFDGEEVMLASHANKYTVSAGTDETIAKNIRWYDKIKDVVDYTTKSGKRFLSKTMKVVIDPLAEDVLNRFNKDNGTSYTIDDMDFFEKEKDIEGMEYLFLYQLMTKNGVDRLATKDGVKFPIGKALNLYKDVNGKKVLNTDLLNQEFEKVNAEDDNAKNAYVIEHSNEHIVMQQDLRNEGKAKETTEGKQMWKNLVGFKNSIKIAEIYNKINDKAIQARIDWMKGVSPVGMRKYILGANIDEIDDAKEDANETDDIESNYIKYLLGQGVDVLHPYASKLGANMFANVTGKKTLGRKILKSLLVEVGRLGVTLEDMKMDKDGNVFMGEVMVPKSLGLREAEYFKTKEEALKAANQHKDLVGFLHEVREVNGKWKVPGEFVMVTRIPADAPHSHNLMRVERYSPSKMKNIIITNSGAAEISGSDLDGDQRHTQQFFKTKYQKMVDGKMEDVTEIIDNKNVAIITQQKINEKLKRALKKAKTKAEITEITNKVTKNITEQVELLKLANDAFALNIEDYYDKQNFPILTDAINLSQFNKTIDKLDSNKKSLNKNSPEHLISAFNNAGVGLKCVSIGSLMIGAYNVGQKLGVKLKASFNFIAVNIDSGGNISWGEKIKLSSLAKKASSLGNLLNLALDNLKEMKIETLGMNEQTVKMYYVLHMLRPDKISEEKWAETVAGFFNTDIVKDWVVMNREVNDVGNKNLSKDIYDNLLSKYAYEVGTYEKGRMVYEHDVFMNNMNESDVNTIKDTHRQNASIIMKLKELDSITKEIETFQKVVSLVDYDGMPKSYTEYVMALDAWNSVTSKKGLEYLDTSSVKDSPLFAIVPKVFEAAKLYLEQNSLELTKTGQDIFDTILESKPGEKAKFNKKELQFISDGIYNSVLSIAMKNDQLVSDTQKAAFEWFNSLPETNVLKEVLGIIESKDKNDVVYKNLQVVQAYKKTISDEMLAKVRMAFSELKQKEKDLLIKYLLNGPGITTSTFSGGFSLFFDDKTQEMIGDKMREMHGIMNQNTNYVDDIVSAIRENDNNGLLDYDNRATEKQRVSTKKGSFAGITGTKRAGKDYGTKSVIPEFMEKIKNGDVVPSNTEYVVGDTITYVNSKNKNDIFAAEVVSIEKVKNGLYNVTFKENTEGQEISDTGKTVIPKYEVDYNLQNKDGSKRLASADNNGKITINPVKTVDEFFDYFEGKQGSVTSVQKGKVLEMVAKKGWTLDKIKDVLSTPKLANTFLVLHEQSHIDNNDKDVYWSKGQDMMSQDKLEIEVRATIDALIGVQDIKKGSKVSTAQEAQAQPSTSVKPTVKDLSRWADLKDATNPYTNEGIVVTRISNTKEHFGNPFIGSQRRDKNGNLVKSKVDNITVFNTIDEADQAYRDWLSGTKHQNIQPLRRKWILDQINEGKLDGKTLLYYKPMEVTNNDGIIVRGGYHSHADTLAEIVEELRSKPTQSSTSVEIEFQEEPTTGYKNRTVKNASADATIALAYDFTSAGERLTKSSVLGQNKKYIPLNIPKKTDTSDVNNASIKTQVDIIVNALNSVNAKTLNIAGNGIYTMKDAGWNQEEVDLMTYKILKGVIESPNLKNKIVSIRSGGQTGFDEAGAKAGIKLGIPTSILAPKDWKFRNLSGTDISNEQQFKARFAQLSTTQAKTEVGTETETEVNDELAQENERKNKEITEKRAMEDEMVKHEWTIHSEDIQRKDPGMTAELWDSLSDDERENIIKCL